MSLIPTPEIADDLKRLNAMYGLPQYPTNGPIRLRIVRALRWVEYVIARLRSRVERRPIWWGR